MASAESQRMKEIGGVGTMTLVLHGGLLWMVGDSVLVPVWRSVGDGLTGKGELYVWVARAGPRRPGSLHRSTMDYLPYLISC